MGGSKKEFLRTRTTRTTYDVRPEKKLLLTLPFSDLRPGSNPITTLTYIGVVVWGQSYTDIYTLGPIFYIKFTQAWSAREYLFRKGKF